MPITNAAKKALRQNKRRRERNLNLQNKMRREIKNFLDLVEDKKTKKAKNILPKVYKVIDKAAKNNIISDNKASRKKSQLAKKINN
ncbi:MAG: 30S ribosomal protein S20 [Minisyncoccales bacterium]